MSLLDSGPLSAAELAKAVSEPRPSVYRIVAALEQINVVRAAGDNRFELGTALLRWSDAAVASFVNRHALRKEMRWVRDQLGMNVYFCVPHHNGVLCLDHVDGTAVDMLGLGPGRMLPRHAGAASSALMAFASPAAQEELFAAAPFEPIASNTPTTAETLRAKFDQTVARGWSVDDSEVVEGVAAVAVPVRRADGSSTGVISVAGLRASVLQQETAAGQVLQVAAQRIADAMAAARAAITPMNGTETRATETPEPEATRAPSLVVKAGALMEALAQERIATSARLTEMIDEPVSSVYRMLATLADIGWVEQIGHRGAYRIGGKLLSLASEPHPPSRHSPRVAASPQTHPRSNRGDHVPVRTPRHSCRVHRTHRWSASQQPSTPARPLTAVTCRRSTACAIGLRGPRGVGRVRHDRVADRRPRS